VNVLLTGIATDIASLGAANLDISWPISDFKRICQEWDGYNADIHSIRVKHVRRCVVMQLSPHKQANNLRSYQLPDDVFAEGETRPTKKKKGKTPTGGVADSSADNKRGSAAAGLDVSLICVDANAQRSTSQHSEGLTDMNFGHRITKSLLSAFITI
jgi:poly(A) polymerase Pap1